MSALFIGIFPAGISYADRTREEYGDYARLAFLPYSTLKLDVRDNCPPALRAEIEAHAATLKAGDSFRVSTCGQTVQLGGAV
jgi:hypothetical protein